MCTFWRSLSLAGRVVVCSACAMLLTFTICMVYDVGGFRWGLAHRNNQGAPFFLFGLYCITVAGFIGAGFGAFTTRWQIEGKPLFFIVGLICGITLGVFAAYLLGVLAQILQFDNHIFVVTFFNSQESQLNSGEFIVRNIVLWFGLPVSAFLGAKVGLHIYYNRLKSKIAQH